MSHVVVRSLYALFPHCRLFLSVEYTQLNVPFMYDSYVPLFVDIATLWPSLFCLFVFKDSAT